MNEPLAPMTEVKIESFRHMMLAIKYVTASAILEDLEKLKVEYPRTPGLGLAAATVSADVNRRLARLTADNMTLALKHGFDPETQTLSMESRKDGLYLIAKTEEPGDG